MTWVKKIIGWVHWRTHKSLHDKIDNLCSENEVLWSVLRDLRDDVNRLKNAK
jgi:hypothetical protein